MLTLVNSAGNGEVLEHVRNDPLLSLIKGPDETTPRKKSSVSIGSLKIKEFIGRLAYDLDFASFFIFVIQWTAFNG